MSVAALLASLVDYAYYALFALVLAWILISWFPAYPSNAVLQKVYDAGSQSWTGLPSGSANAAKRPFG